MPLKAFQTFLKVNYIHIYSDVIQGFIRGFLYICACACARRGLTLSFFRIIKRGSRHYFYIIKTVTSEFTVTELLCNPLIKFLFVYFHEIIEFWIVIKITLFAYCPTSIFKDCKSYFSDTICSLSGHCLSIIFS